MTDYPSLTHISVAALIGEAGGDPWMVDATVQSGDPGAISDLGRAFFDAGACTAETYKEFEAAQARFRASWNRESGEHPINDSAEVQRATTRLMVQQDQLPAIGADLAGIAATLAETQRFSGMEVANLNTQLEYIDALIGQALANDQDISALEDSAITATSNVLHQVTALRDDYTGKLDASLTALRADHGYDPAPIEDVDGDGELGPEQRGREATDWYDANRRAQDEALVNSGGPMTPEKAAAAARLRDLATTGNPAAAPDARRLAGERLDDFRMANFVGPLPMDPVVGGDARSRARSRLDMQQRLEQGTYGLPPMTSDQATQALDEGEQFGRVVAVNRAMTALTSQGMSEDGAKLVIGDLLKRAGDVTAITGPVSEGVEAYAERIPGGRHAMPEDLLSPSDAAKWAHIAGKVGKFGDLIELGTAVNDFAHGGSAEEFGSTLGGVAGGSAAAWGAAALAGSFTGPWTTAAIVVAASVLGGVGGEQLGGGIGSVFDTASGTGSGGG
ncbi:hypothetical protein [Mycobacterium sp. DL592]|uniref:putative alpha/beta hydrolase n=1 Tax=Mycobacterium sp. DL592 TaxID=2675524 RepID=UPI0014211CEB|nr:hypothetical protein [Mycobacterium sp. DL592]